MNWRCGAALNQGSAGDSEVRHFEGAQRSIRAEHAAVVDQKLGDWISAAKIDRSRSPACRTRSTMSRKTAIEVVGISQERYFDINRDSPSPTSASVVRFACPTIGENGTSSNDVRGRKPNAATRAAAGIGMDTICTVRQDLTVDTQKAPGN